MLPKICSIPECGKDAKARGWCGTHYSRWRLRGDPTITLYIRKDNDARFWVKVNKSGPTPSHAPNLGRCWDWTASEHTDGYGEFRLNGKVRKAHRVSYEMANGDIPEDKDLDHRCRNRKCVRPDHLRLVTNKQNCEHRSVDSNNTSGYRGVSFHSVSKKWQVYVTHNGRRRYGGNFLDVHEAGAAAQAMRNQLFTHNDLDRSAA